MRPTGGPAGRPPVADVLLPVADDLQPALETELLAIVEELRHDASTAGAGADAAWATRDAHQGRGRLPHLHASAPPALAALAARLERRSVLAETPVLVQDGACPGLQIVLRGRLVVELDDHTGTRRPLGEPLPGSVVGEIGR